MKYLIGIDDTDTLETRGTGFHARQMAAEIMAKKVGVVSGVTRHQNVVHPGIQYTSQNSSACLAVETENFDTLVSFCRTFLLDIAPEGSDVGLCVVAEENVTKEMERWGHRAKTEVLKKADALKVAAKYNIYLEGLTGTHDGIIGALAAVGLRKGGNDGRFIWLMKNRELRELRPGLIHPDVLKFSFGVESIVFKDGEPYTDDQKIYVHEWFRPVLKNNKVTLIVEEHFEHGKTYWKSASKDYIRAHS